MVQLQKNNTSKLVLDIITGPCYNGTIETDKGYKMSEMKEYTLEIYKVDRRTKEGRRLYAKQDFAPSTDAYIKAVAESKRKLGFIVEVFNTYVTTRSAMSGQEFQERYDTPYYCSPRSESYWSM
jgi:hypothetical protein